MSSIFIVNDTKITKRGKGRPKTFKREQALDAAMGVFFEHGYQGASMAELSKAMGMNPPSIYNAFTDKETLFIEVLEHYHMPYRTFMTETFEHGASVQDSVKTLFQASENQHAKKQAMGCLIVNSSSAAPDEHTVIGAKLKELHDINENTIYKGLKNGQENGEILESVNIRKLARYINGVFQGAAVTARGQHSAKAVKDLLDQGYNSFLKIIN